MASIKYVAPEYDELDFYDQRPKVCDKCGCVVGSDDKHTAFHLALTKLINVAATNKQIRGITD